MMTNRRVIVIAFAIAKGLWPFRKQVQQLELTVIRDGKARDDYMRMALRAHQQLTEHGVVAVVKYFELIPGALRGTKPNGVGIDGKVHPYTTPDLDEAWREMQKREGDKP